MLNEGASVPESHAWERKCLKHFLEPEKILKILLHFYQNGKVLRSPCHYWSWSSRFKMAVTPDPDPLQCVSGKLGNVKGETFSYDKQFLVKKMSMRLSWGFVASTFLFISMFLLFGDPRRGMAFHEFGCMNGWQLLMLGWVVLLGFWVGIREQEEPNTI